MRRAVLNGAGPPSAFELEEAPVPAAAAGEVVVRVERCGVSSRDVVERNGTYRRDVTYPLTIGLEIAGVVTEVGPGVDQLAVGDTVCTKAFAACGHCRLCRGGRESTCLARRPVRGGYGEYTALAADAVVRRPPTLPAEQACCLGPAAGVALNAVRDTARVQLGETVLVTGASGGVGSAAVQIAALAGARVIALTRSKAKAAALREDGAEEVVVDDGGGDAAREQLREITDGRGVEVVVDTVGSPLFDLCFDALAVHGRLAFVGELTGGSAAINPARIFFKRAALLGVGSVSRAQLEDAIELAAAGRLRTRVRATLPLGQVARAHELVETAEAPGRVLLDPGQGDRDG
ncbi:MAG TPA: zinc-binding dehydrogenase [Solirubrobacterales bacterium]|jgi:NADPH:quinone reductase-like Zn-dependent oxidoreductase